MRLSVHYRLPLSEVMAWPASTIRLLRTFTAIEPFPETRLAWLVARGIAEYLTLAQGGKGTPVKASQVMPFLDPWAKLAEDDTGAPTGRYSKVDLSIIAALGGGGKK